MQYSNIVRQKKEREGNRTESILKRLGEIRLATGGQERMAGEWQEGRQIRTRAFSGENRFLFFVRESEMSRKSPFTGCDLDFLLEQPNRCVSKPSTFRRPRATRVYSGADRIFRRLWRGRGKRRPEL